MCYTFTTNPGDKPSWGKKACYTSWVMWESKVLREQDGFVLPTLIYSNPAGFFVQGNKITS